MCHVAGHEKSLAPFKMNGFQKHFHLPDEQHKRDHHRRYEFSTVENQFRFSVREPAFPPANLFTNSAEVSERGSEFK